MRKISIFLLLTIFSFTSFAQLDWNTPFNKTAFNDAQTLISKSSNVKYSDGLVGLGGGLKMGKTIVAIPVVNPNPDPYNEEAVIALPRTGLADSITFTWSGTESITFSVYQSVDHNNWTGVWTGAGSGSIVGGSGTVKMPLAHNTRYVKFAATGKAEATYKEISISEMTALSINTDERTFANAIVGDQPETKQVIVTWTSIVASVSSTNPQFAVSTETIGAKAQAGNEAAATNQQTAITISYLHAKAGHHTGDIVIAGEGREVRVHVSGDTEKAHPQVAPQVANLTYGQTLAEAVITDELGKVPGIFSFVDYADNTILDAGEYNLNLLFIPEDTTSYYTANASVWLTVDKAQQTITWLNQDTALVENQPTALTAELSSGLPLTYAFTACAAYVNEDQTQIVGTEPTADGESVLVIAFHLGNNNYLPTTVAMQAFTIAPAPENPTSLESLSGSGNLYDELTPAEMRDAQKFYHDGQVIIYHNSRIYDTTGRRIK